MTTRIDARFAELKKQGRSAFVTFLMAGDPDPATSLDIIKALPKAGADIIEIGMPFTDPMADGPSIQAAGLRALKSRSQSAPIAPLAVGSSYTIATVSCSRWRVTQPRLSLVGTCAPRVQTHMSYTLSPTASRKSSTVALTQGNGKNSRLSRRWR